MVLEEQVKDCICAEAKTLDEHGLFREPLVAFAAARDPLFQDIKKYAGPQQLYPWDILPEAKTVVCFFVPFQKHVIESNRGGDEVSRTWALAYDAGNQVVNGISEKLVEFFAQNNIQAATIQATQGFDKELLMAGWSHRSAAYVAGLGMFGLNKMLITEKGCAGRFGTVVAACDLAPTTRQETQRCMSLQGGNCKACIKACPEQALTEQDIVRHTCYNRCLETDKAFPDIGLCDCCGKCSVGPCAYYA